MTPSRYDDELWELVPEDPGPPPEHLRRFVRSLGPVERALDLGCGDGRLTASSTRRSSRPRMCRRSRSNGRPPAAGRAHRRAGARRPAPVRRRQLRPRPLRRDDRARARRAAAALGDPPRAAPGGTLALTTPANLPLGRPPDPLSPHLRFFTRRSLRRLLDELGFEVESLRRRSGTLLARATR